MYRSLHPPRIETPKDIIFESNPCSSSIPKPSEKIDQALRLPMKRELNDFMNDDVVFRLYNIVSVLKNDVLSLANQRHQLEFPLLAVFALGNDIRSLIIYLISNQLSSTVAPEHGLKINDRQRKDLTKLVVVIYPHSYNEVDIPNLNFIDHNKTKNVPKLPFLVLDIEIKREFNFRSDFIRSVSLHTSSIVFLSLLLTLGLDPF